MELQDALHGHRYSIKYTTFYARSQRFLFLIKEKTPETQSVPLDLGQ